MIYDDFDFCKIVDEFLQKLNYQNSSILEIIKISKINHDRFTANYPKFRSSHTKKYGTILHQPFKKNVKDLSPMLI